MVQEAVGRCDRTHCRSASLPIPRSFATCATGRPD